jgi:broad specificity phosphatase PhoE
MKNHLILLIFRRFVPLLVLLSVPASALDTIYVVRHGEKAWWPSDREVEAFQPLSPAGVQRAGALASRLKSAGIAAIYCSRTTRCLQTGAPLAETAKVSLIADDATTKPDQMGAFLAHLREKHATDRAVLLVGHSNTIPELLVHLGARPECFQRLGISGQPGSLLIEGYEGLWKIDLARQGCEALTRE